MMNALGLVMLVLPVILVVAAFAIARWRAP